MITVYHENSITVVIMSNDATFGRGRSAVRKGAGRKEAVRKGAVRKGAGRKEAGRKGAGMGVVQGSPPGSCCSVDQVWLRRRFS